MKKLYTILLLFVFALYAICANNLQAQTKPLLLKQSSFKHYVDYFNTMETPNIEQAIPNDSAWSWMQKNIPFISMSAAKFRRNLLLPLVDLS